MVASSCGFFFSSRRRHTRWPRDWSSDVCSSDLTRRKQQLARAVCLAPIVLDEHPRRAVQLRHNDTLVTVDDKGTAFSHQRPFAHVDLLFLDLFDGRFAELAIHTHQTDFVTQRYGIGQSPLLPVFHV